MRFSEDFCRNQAALQRAKAATEPLDNRQKIALLAAKTWDAEADAISNCKAAHGSPLDKLDAAITLEFAREEAAEANDQDYHQK
jgi:hypothetical protein